VIARTRPAWPLDFIIELDLPVTVEVAGMFLVAQETIVSGDWIVRKNQSISI
jgi:hypothetical protein